MHPLPASVHQLTLNPLRGRVCWEASQSACSRLLYVNLLSPLRQLGQLQKAAVVNVMSVT